MEKEFLKWLVECRYVGDLDDMEVEECFEHQHKAYALFMDFLNCDKEKTAKLVQKELRGFKKYMGIE